MLGNRRKLTLIIKTSYNCNLACRYCYEGGKQSSTQISLETVANTINKVADYVTEDAEVEFIWHGGEPLLMGIEFYSRVLEIQRHFPVKILNSMQTNGLLLTDETAEFLSKNGYHVGLSLDGPAVIHDAQRTTLGNKPTFGKVWSALERTRKYKLNGNGKNSSGLAVFTKITLEHIDEFYNFFKNNHINVKVNPLMSSGNASLAPNTKLSISPQEYGQAMIYLFDKWISEVEYTFSIDPLEGILESFATGKSSSCAFSGHCYDRYLSIDPSGNIVPCGRWSNTDICYGNINSDDLVSALRSSAFFDFRKKRLETMNNCQTCEHYELCRGGCSFSGYLKRGMPSDADFYCESYKMLFTHMKDYIKNYVYHSSN